MPLPPLARLQSRFLVDESHGCRPKAAQARWHSRVSSLVTWKLREYALPARRDASKREGTR